MDFLGPVVQIILFFWAPVSQQIGYLKHLNNNVETLKKETEELQDRRDEITADVNHAISVGKTRVRQVEIDNWLVDVTNIEAQVDSLRREFEQPRTCLNGCCTNHFSRYKLGKRVFKKLKDVKELKGKGDFGKVAESPRRPTVLEMQTSLPRVQQSTAKETMEEIWQCLHDEENSLVGVYGMGGIGKTTLMKAINNRFIGTNDFNVVIWVTVSNDLNLGLIQEQIGNALDMKFQINEEKRSRLFARLKNVRYLLILDDLWKAFSLDQVGIPKPTKQNRCKIVITTRSIEVCNNMGADKQIRVKTLTLEEARNLFYERCGDVSPEIRPLAEKVVEECSGLPLAIRTVGRAMYRKDKKELWENALTALKGSSPDVVTGMEREVFLPLKFSYDCLENEAMKSCFLYCSLFPEDYDIEIDKLVRYWAMEEGFIENVNNLEEASNKGHYFLERIKDACLLEEGSRGKYVRLHDLLRDLAIWITSPSSSSIEGSKFLVKAGEGLEQPPEEKMWRGVVRISLMRSKIKDLEISPACPNLISLFLNENYHLRTIHSNFFQLMPKLQILDLSCTGIESLPMSLLQLVNLRVLILHACRSLVEVLQLGTLKELQILDLSGSDRLKNFPQGIESLVKLKRLDIDGTSFTAVPYTVIYGLPSLEEVSMMDLTENVDVATFRDAVNMTRLRSLRISLSNLTGFIADDMFGRWFSGLKSFNVAVNHSHYPILSNKNISIRNCDKFPWGIEELTNYAFSLCLYEAEGFTSLSKFHSDLKNLREIQVDQSSRLECFIDWREARDDAFQCLQRLDLESLPNMKKVFDGGAPRQGNTSLQNLRIIRVFRCEKLRSLFSSSMVEQLHQLEELDISVCSKMKEIIEGDKLPHNSFPKLRSVKLGSLPELESICSQRFMFISLEEMEVIFCPKLKKLPLFSSSIREIKGEIKGKKEWWDGLEWEDENACRYRSLCSTIYKEAS